MELFCHPLLGPDLVTFEGGRRGKVGYPLSFFISDETRAFTEGASINDVRAEGRGNDPEKN